MKKLLNMLMLALMIIIAVACGKDNYEKPGSLFTGRVVYNGQPLGVSGANRQNYLQFWQDGYQLKTSFSCRITQDGSYSATLFDGTYKLVMNSNRGPWVNSPDTVTVVVSGNTTKDYEVTPYYMLGNISYALNGNTLTASFDVTAINTTRAIANIALIVNKTFFVDNQETGHVGWVRQGSVTAGRHTMTLDVGQLLSSNDALYARVGLEIAGITQWLFDTNVYKVK